MTERKENNQTLQTSLLIKSKILKNVFLIFTITKRALWNFVDEIMLISKRQTYIFANHFINSPFRFTIYF